ncbi:MAG: phytoene desaturase [Candidatus Nanopelagicaceae bacterium]|nr:phytoene desaturase [Candidatus Nanopelagicaceae bacterium]
MSKVIVIGAGIGGMSAAARMAKAGHQVEIYEAANFVGGKCRTEWIGRYAFDTGPSLLTLPAVYRDFFLKTGALMEDVLTQIPVDPSFDYRFADGSSVKFANLSRYQTLQAITVAFGEQAAKEWDLIMKRAEAMWDVSREPFIESELTSVAALFKRATLIRDLLIIAPLKSLRDLATEKLTDQRLRYIVDRYATYSGSDPRKAPAVLLSIAFVEEAFGAWHLAGGIGQLAIAIEKRCLDLGVVIHLNSPVAQIKTQNGVATGISLSDGRELVADYIVSNSDASLTYQHLISPSEKRAKSERKNLAKTQSSLAGFSLLLGLRPDESSEKLNHHTILFPENYDAEFESIFTEQQPVASPTIYICAPNDPLMVKDAGHESWFVLVNAPRHDLTGKSGYDWSDENFSHKYANSIIDQIEARGIKIRERLDVLEIRTPLDLQESVMAPGGSIYGTASNSASAAFLRTKNRSPIKNLFCVGGSTHPGGGLPLVGISAEIVANAIGRAR